MAAIAPGAAIVVAAGQVEEDRLSWVGSNPGSSGKHKPMLKLKNFLAQRLLPGCLRRAGTVTPSDEQEDVLFPTWPQFDGGAMDVQPLPPVAGSCSEQQPGKTVSGLESSTHSASSLVVLKDGSTTSQQAPAISKQVHLEARSDFSTVSSHQHYRQQQQQDLLVCKQAVSMQVMSAAAEEVATEPVEQVGLIAAVRQPSGLVQQAEVTANDEPAHQVRALAVCLSV